VEAKEKQLKIKAIAPALVLAGLGATSMAAEGLDLANETARINYSVGYQIGGDFKRQGVDLDADAVVRGIEDALRGGEPLMSQPDMHQTLVELKRKIVADQNARSTQPELQQLDAGRKFMEANAKKPGVVATASGLQYQILEPGVGKHPDPTAEITCRYRGTYIDGHEFDSSGDSPATFRLNGVIKGWTEGLQLIGEGGRIRLFVPPDLAYGDRGPLAHRTLIFDVELISARQPG
jgi:FKBP-type peptidyl-prolyl cis-trans isomerase FklB